MKIILSLLLLVPTLVWSVAIPVEKFDQSKLENLLRRMPSTFVDEVQDGDKIIKTFKFPQDESPFQITCQSTWFGESPLPTYKSCLVEVEKGEVQGITSTKINDVYQIKISEAKAVSELYSAMSFGEVVKKMNAFERVKGKAETGRIEEIFRYAFICQAQECTLRLISLPPAPEE